MAAHNLRVKVASEPWELEQIYALNYRTFVEEIPQHSPNAERRLVDRLLAKSRCFVCVEEHRLRGMVAICDERPYSLDAKIADLDSYLPPHERSCEVRLLAVEKNDRGGLVFASLMATLLSYCNKNGYELAVLSGALSQIELYRHMGCVAFGPPLGTEQAPYQGMYLTWTRLNPTLRRRSELIELTEGEDA